MTGPVSDSPSLVAAAASGDRAATLRALRDRLALEVETSNSARDVAALSRQLTDVLSLIEALPKPAEGTPLDELTQRRGRASSTRTGRAHRKPQ